MYFATLPPEINSGRMYTGPGAAPMLAMAEAWGNLAAELYSTASSYELVVSGLGAGPWLGPAATMMTTAAATYVTWTSGTAAQAEQTAGQAIAAAAAYESAFAATVPPEVVAANRFQLMVLIATNLLGQNTAAIAATEALYSEMWAQDATAMYGYAASSASATQLTPFVSPQQTTNATAATAQSAAVSQVGATAAGDAQGALTQLSQFLSAVPNALADLASSNLIGSYSPTDILDIGADLIAFVVDAPMSPLGAISLPIDLVGAQTGLHTDDIVSGWSEFGALPAAEAPSLSGGAKAAVGLASAGVGEANTVGGLSVPPTWTAATPAVRPVALALPATSVGIDPQFLSTSLENAVGDTALASAAGRALSDTLGARGGERVRAAVGSRNVVPAEAVTTADDDAAAHGGPRTVVTGIAAEIREFAKLRDDGLISDEQYIEQRNRLLDLGRPDAGSRGQSG